jgi:primosomal protein N' (replication factor Y)
LKLKNPLIVRLAVPVILDQLFDYFIPENIPSDKVKIGLRVIAPFHGKEMVAIIIEIQTSTTIQPEKLKPILKILDTQPLLKDQDRQLLHWLCRYYHYPIGYVFCNTLPSLLKKGKEAVLKKQSYYQLTQKGQQIDFTTLTRAPKQQVFLQKLHQSPLINEKALKSLDNSWARIKIIFLKKEWITCEFYEDRPLKSHELLNETALILNKAQQKAVEQIHQAFDRFKVFLLDGVTGSGKTEVYMQLITKILEKNQQVLVLLPEITLTPQLENRFKQRFNVPIVVYHSKLTDPQRLQSWLAIKMGQASILLGTRSALFTPFKHLGLMILDEEHDSSFKQQDTLRFSARDVAIMRAKLCAIPIVLGSATPSLESFANVEKNRYAKLLLPKRAGKARPPNILLLDIRHQRVHQGFSPALLVQIKQTLAKKEQVLIFLNRRGFAPRLMCHSCGWVACCYHCDANLVIHQQKRQLRCHHCQQIYQLINQCPACQKNNLNALGLGTERIEQLLKQQYPDKNIVRLDAETTQKKGTLERYLVQIEQGQVDIILGTQMLAKGHHFPNVTLAVLLDVDSRLFSLDFRAPEKLAQLIIQVAGRSGRGHQLGKVLIQTRHPEHPLFDSLIKYGYSKFAQQALIERQNAQLPPYSHQALLRIEAVDEQWIQKFFEPLQTIIDTQNTAAILVLGPVPAPMEKREGRYRYQLLFQSENRVKLQRFLTVILPEINALKIIRKVRWSLDVDPIDLF